MGILRLSNASLSCRYIAGRFKIISNEDAKGLNTFIGTFALPSLIFTSLVQLDWSTVNWMFLLAILIAKSIIFFGVGIVSLLMSRPLNYGRAGILSIFCTQSNDFAIGAPIVAALYHKAHPDYGAYLYLMAPLSLAILNPIGYILLEWSSVKKSSTKQENYPSTTQEQVDKISGPSKKQLVLAALKSIVFNPILFMTVFGVIGGFLLKDGLPKLVAGVLNVFGNAFSATALFSLGLRMVDSTKHFCGPQLLTPIVLILMKEYAPHPLMNFESMNFIEWFYLFIFQIGTAVGHSSNDKHHQSGCKLHRNDRFKYIWFSVRYISISTWCICDCNAIRYRRRFDCQQHGRLYIRQRSDYLHFIENDFVDQSRSGRLFS